MSMATTDDIGVRESTFRMDWAPYLSGAGIGVLSWIALAIAMVFYGYCPGTGLAAIATGSVHALVGALGMFAGGILFALSFDWVKANILTVGAYGKIRLPDVTGISAPVWFAGLAVVAIAFFVWAERRQSR